MIKKLKGFQQIDPMDLQLSPFKSINNDWMEICVGEKDGEVGAMTASWGGMGILWNKPVAFLFIRGAEHRFTRHILEQRPVLSLNFLGDDKKDAKIFLGRNHGWDFDDKIAAAGLTRGWCGVQLEHTAAPEDDKWAHTPFIEESETVLICETMALQELQMESIISPSVKESFYGAEGPHGVFIVEIKAAFVRQ